MLKEIAIGRIRKTHGVKGYLKVMSFSGEYDHFMDLEKITLKSKDQSKIFKIEEVTPFSGEILIKLEGIDTPEKGKLLSGWDIWVPREHAAHLEQGEFYHADLHGCQILLEGKVIGSVQSILESGSNDLLEIKTEKGMKLIPFNSVFIGGVDTENKTIELLEGWILD
ncbi:16S rRNA processing protein RimM [Oceanispirochaeta crateris]|jgi:16S rRNA processing protein RimM|uniref:Ribosome maturation factor RimM n=1 Tax=Oceanispirochaeta crateris TaxID=2518645 RepID=A0A5C1QHC2_9SPIO|nr:ribosome maturation factor RimM [Oceanispirochaeta crateris]QEN07533.1 16S rRNA processing protein RimM [Oceanispirochaeta crateris]